MLSISDYSKSYGFEPVLDIRKQNFPVGNHLIQGSNGSGKTTLFKSIAGMLKFDGEIALQGEISLVKDPVKYRLHVSYCEAEPRFPPFLTAHDLISFVAKAKKASKQQVNSLIEALNLDSFIHQPVKTYSSGMLKKTSLLLGFLGHPRVILLDEPFTTIDADTLKSLAQLISQHQQGCVFLISTHQDLKQIPVNFKSTFFIDNKKLNIRS
ncbi:ABC transporter ATP-binding protein [Fulvivirga sp. 29W222]|uniref:ABC transporter ATP-binding protein n=1 Tax=Fulvivirga marina TaxID=2494733 RepID=A0A937KD09_9BACT|nr:ABC transporter ATP-binding protein [Fulvivirga marina]MBL6447979.1 ABC transporter ATP-binding protein [Fulvivirga marina]